MIFGLLLAIIISVFAVCAAVVVLWRFRDWRFGFLAGLCFLASAWVLMTQLSRFIALLDKLPLTFAGYEQAFPAAVLSLMVLSSIFFLERIVSSRTQREQNLKLARVSLDRASIPAFWLTAEGGIRYANDGASMRLGYSREGLCEKSLFDLAPLYPPADWARDRETIQERGSATLEVYFKARDGEIFPVDVTAIHVGAQEEDLICVFARDITERKQAEADLKIAMGKVKTADRAKSEFLNTMSHELRTPLNAIIGFGEMMEMEIFGPLKPARYKNCASDILYSARHLLGMINGVLDLSKAEAGGLSLEEEEVDVGEIFTQCLRLFSEKAAQQGVDISLETPGAGPRLRADPRILRQIVINLLSNAVKFTPEGGTIAISAAGGPDGGCIIEVRDTGCGIAEQDLARVMEPFVQAENAMTRQHEGTGLGLPLVKQYAELHGGRFEIDSVPGAGTTARVSFPPERSLPPDASADSEVAPKPPRPPASEREAS